MDGDFDMGTIDPAVANTGLNMTGIATALTFCAWIGTLIVCIVLIIYGVLRWLSNPAERTKRLDTAAWISLVILFVMYLIHKRSDIVMLFGKDSTATADLTSVVINASKIAVKLLTLGAVLACTLLLLSLVFLFIRYVIAIIIVQVRPDQAGNQAATLQAKSDDFFSLMKTPILMMVITFGILATFVIIPLLMGGPTAQGVAEISSAEQNPAEQSLAAVWKNGVLQIASFFEKNDEAAPVPDQGTSSGITETSAAQKPGEEEVTASNARNSTYNSFSNALISYILIYIIVLGVCFAAIQIIYSIIGNCFNSKNSGGIIDEYSGSIGVLAVGISILWSVKSGVLQSGDLSTILGEFIKSFVVVMLIIALGILALETIRLLMDMKEKLIRVEARYLFIAFVGFSAHLLLSMLGSVYGAVNTVIGGGLDSELEDVQKELRVRIIKEMENHMVSAKDFKTTFTGFKATITKK